VYERLAGELHLLVKTYFGTDSFPPGGTLGNFLDVLEVGEEVDARGPLGEVSSVTADTWHDPSEAQIAYEGNGDFTIEGKKHHFDRLSLVSGGSGITPIYQLVHAICKRPDDRTQIRLVNCDKDVRAAFRAPDASAECHAQLSDVLLLMELRELEAQSNGRFKMWIILSHPDPKDGDWDQGKGHLDDEAIKVRPSPPATRQPAQCARRGICSRPTSRLPHSCADRQRSSPRLPSRDSRRLAIRYDDVTSRG
jgi:nitrate reductase (NAD(P)H)